MSLIDLKTDLKSLKYGQDQPGGGSSGQPYIQTDINTVDTGINRFRLTRFDDGLIRGGVVGATNASVIDTIRIGKFLKDFPKGPLFIVKQVGLQLSNPRLETKAGITGFFQGQPTRIYNLGINTLAQVPVNAFGGHLNRHGLLPVQDNQTKYFFVALSNNTEKNNRLTRLQNRFGLGSTSKYDATNSILRRRESRLLNILSAAASIISGGETFANTIFNDIQTSRIDDYIGGPGSVYGIGRTTIRRRGDFIVVNQDITENEWAVKTSIESGKYYRINGHSGTKDGYIDASRRITNFTGVSDNTGSSFAPNSVFFTDGKSILFKDRNNTPLGLDDKNISTYEPSYKGGDATLIASNGLGSGSNAISSYGNITTEPNNIRTGIDRISYGSSKTYAALKNQIDNQKSSSLFGIYGDITSINKNNNQDSSLNSNTEFLPNSPSNPTYFNGYTTVRVNIPWNKATREIRVGSGKTDSINLTPIFDAKAGTIGDTPPINIPGTNVQTINDLVKFRIQALNGADPTQAQWMIFRAYITQFSDNTDATWNPVKYMGRGEEFYIYNGFSRKIQIGFKVAALSAIEMEPMYQKLNFLQGNVMPDYTDTGLMRGPLVKMTVGNWLDGQDGILTSVGYTIPNDSPWEIALNTINGNEPLVLPHIVEVSLGFTPIGSQTKGINKISAKSTTTSHIAQNYNDYQYIK